MFQDEIMEDHDSGNEVYAMNSEADSPLFSSPKGNQAESSKRCLFSTSSVAMEVASYR